MLLVAVTRKEIYNPLRKRASVKNPTSYVMLLGKILKQQWKHRNVLLLLNEESVPLHSTQHLTETCTVCTSGVKVHGVFLIVNLCSPNS